MMTRTAAVRALVIAAVALVLTLAYAQPYGVLNQATYLLDPLHRAMPELFSRDWLVSETPPYLPVFGWLARWLFELDPEGIVAVGAAHVVVMLAIYAAIAWLCSAASADLRVFVLVASVMAMTMGRTLGGNYVISGYLQPSSLASLGWVIAMAALARQRYLACGIALALGGLLHANFLVLGLGLFTLTALVGHDVTRGELLRLLAPQLAVVAYSLPALLAASGPSAEAVRVLVEFHAPTHYAPGRLLRHMPPLVMWQVAAWAVIPLYGTGDRGARVLWRFSLLSCGITVASTLLMLIPSLAWITQVRWARMAPFGQLACQVLIAGAMIRYATGPAISLARRAWLAVSLGLAIVVWNWKQFRRPMLELVGLVTSVVDVFVVPRRFARYAATLAAAAMLALALWTYPPWQATLWEPAESPGETEMAAWVRSHTAVDALFFTPPWLQRFRLLTRRSIIVDTKSPPLRPDLLVAWYRRMCAAVQLGDAASFQQVEQRWRELTPEQRVAVAQSFGAEYIVVTAGIELPWAPLHRNGEYAVYQTPSR